MQTSALQDSTHEQVMVRRDAVSGLTAVIAIHSSVLGPAAGGVRRWQYASTEAALLDALRLSEGMTYKNALAGIPFGGGKSVILADNNAQPSEHQLQQFAAWLNELQGRYVTAEDVGMGVPQMQVMSATTPYVSGLGHRGIGGDPSPKTAYGVYLGLKAAVQHQLGVEHLHGVRVAVQGLGSVGMALCHWLARAGAQLWVNDLNEGRMYQAQEKFGAHPVSPEALLETPVDVFAPCALGGVITEPLAHELDVAVIAGAANNQLASPICGDILAVRGVLYAPDFVINAGGVISVAHEYLTQQGMLTDVPEHGVEQWAGERINAIPNRLMNIVQAAQGQQSSTERTAQNMALQIIAAGGDRAAIAA